MLSIGVIPPINDALDATANLLSKQYKANFPVWQLRRGGICLYESDPSVRPDWGLSSEDFFDQMGYFYNFMPGDSKISSKWSAGMVKREANKDAEEHGAKPIQQVGAYCDKTRSRYGFLISDKELTVIELRRDPIGPGIAATATRSRAAAAAATAMAPTADHHRVTSIGSVSTGIASLSLSTGGREVSTPGSVREPSASISARVPSTSSYRNTDLGDAVHMRYKVISWDAKGEGQLTVRLALFCLSLLAGYGNGKIDEDFSDMDSWSFGDFHQRMLDTPERYQRVEGGYETLMQSIRRRWQGGNNPGDDGDDGDDNSSDDDESSSDDSADARLPYMADPYHVQDNKKYVRRSVISSDASGPFYHDTDGSRRSIREDQLLYDREANEWGYIRGGEWVVRASTQDHMAQSSGGGGESSRQGKHARKESTEPGAAGSRSKRGRGGR